jgi:hypothetical protein
LPERSPYCGHFIIRGRGASVDQRVSAIKVSVHEEPNQIINDAEKHGWVDWAEPHWIRINSSAGADQCLAQARNKLRARRRDCWIGYPMNKVLCCVAQIGVLVASLVCGAPAFAQEPGSPPETSAPPPKQGPSGGHRGMLDPDEQLARMTTRYSLTAEQQDQVKPILVTQQHQIQELRDDTRYRAKTGWQRCRPFAATPMQRSKPF